MPPPKGQLWEYFRLGDKQNSSHYRAHCYGCLENHRPSDEPIAVDDDGNTQLTSDDWIVEGTYLECPKQTES